MPIKALSAAIAALMTSGGAFATGYDFNIDYDRAAAQASQYTSGYNSVSATSSSYQNGSSFNGAASSLQLQGTSYANVQTTDNGIQYEAGVSDLKVLTTSTLSDNQGNAYGQADAYGHAYGSGDASGNSYSRDTEGTYHYWYGTDIDSDARARAYTHGEMDNSVNANSHNGTFNGGNGLSVNNALSGAAVDLAGGTFADDGSAGAFDSKSVTTFTDTVHVGNGYAGARSNADAWGGAWQSTEQNDYQFSW